MKQERDNRETEFYKNYKPINLNDAKNVVGTCMSMCPEFECLDRQVLYSCWLVYLFIIGYERSAWIWNGGGNWGRWYAYL